MNLDPERSKKIVNDMSEVLGAGAVIEYSGNTNYLLSSLLKANGVKPADLEEQLALQHFFTEVMIEIFGVNREVLDLEIQKCYITMEDIIAKAKANIAESSVDQGTVPIPVADIGADELSLGALLQGLDEIPMVDLPHIMCTPGVISNDEIEGLTRDFEPEYTYESENSDIQSAGDTSGDD